MKYGFLFVTLAFIAVFVLEVLSTAKMHPVQYLFVGIAMIFFYVLLLSLSEHLGFARAYLLASGATGLMLSIYVARVMTSVAKGVIMAVIFGLLYGLLFLILRLMDYALLAGALGGFVMITAVMFLTLGVDWSGGSRVRQTANASTTATDNDRG